jgi:antitoxin component of RelBE/YafQ-DinJ toxin-antitoxin module
VLNSYAVSHALNGKMDDAVRLLNEAIVLNLEIKNELAVRNNYLTLQRINRLQRKFKRGIKVQQGYIND